MAEIKHQIPIQAAPEKVYAALATQQGLRGWWTADTDADEKVGGKAVDANARVLATFVEHPGVSGVEAVALGDFKSDLGLDLRWLWRLRQHGWLRHFSGALHKVSDRHDQQEHEQHKQD